MSVFGTASSIYRCPSLFLRLVRCFLSVSPARFHPPSRRVAVVSEERRGRGGMGVYEPRRVLSSLCIVEQLRPTPRIRTICEYTRSPSAIPSPVFDLFHRSVFSFSRSLFFASFSFFSLSLRFFLSPLPRRGRHFVLRGVANASAMTAAYSQND